MAEYTLKILWCEDRKIFKVRLTIFQHYAGKSYRFNSLSVSPTQWSHSNNSLAKAGEIV